jgi:uncharacterized protein (TIGR00369 family)
MAPSKRTEFYDTLGLLVSNPASGQSVVEIPAIEGFRNSRGELHGGAVLSIADIAASSAVRSCLADGEGVATISLSVNFIGPATEATRAVGRVTSVGGRVAFARVEVESQGRIVADAVATIRLFRRS